MLTLGYITKLNAADDNIFEVRVPVFEKAGTSKDLPDLSGSYFPATLSQIPGQYNAYKVGDCVLIGFLDNHYEKPIIIGKLYLGSSSENIEARGFLDSNSLVVSDSATLPGNTTIGEIEYKDLVKIARAIETLGGQITTVADSGGGGTSDATVGIIVDFTTSINGRVLTNFSLANGGNPIYVAGYPAYKLLYKGNTVTKEQAEIYMENMTGSSYVPEYKYECPKNTYLIRYSPVEHDALNGLILKPQWDATNGLLLFRMKNIGVDANPPLGGGESSLSSIRIGDAKFSVGGGNSTASLIYVADNLSTTNLTTVDGANFIKYNDRVYTLSGRPASTAAEYTCTHLADSALVIYKLTVGQSGTTETRARLNID